MVFLDCKFLFKGYQWFYQSDVVLILSLVYDLLQVRFQNVHVSVEIAMFFYKIVKFMKIIVFDFVKIIKFRLDKKSEN